VKTANVPVTAHRRTHHQVLASASRSAVLHALRDAGEPMGVVEVSDSVGLHQNTTRGHLDVHVEAGFALRHTEPPRGPGRPRIVYSATSAPEDGSNYKLLAEVLAEYVASTAARPAQAAAQAGRAWASRSGSDDEHRGPVDPEAVLDGLVRMLADGGFQPEVASPHEIHLHHCPFGDLAVKHPDVVCGAHLGIIQASLAELGEAPSHARLLPLVERGLCVAQLCDDPAAPDDDAGTRA
jgi:predicted ArsR family transcriptional regulator